MIGGYQILDLRGIDLQKASVASNITNAYVLKQLLQLRDHIDKAYDFSKPLTNQLKPVLIRFRDKKSGEKTEGATFGELSVNGNYYTFKITARISGALVLTINVAFEEITNDYGNKEWVIDTATILLKDESKSITGDLELSGDLSVGGDVNITGDLEADEISGNSIIEKMTGYSATVYDELPNLNVIYMGVCKNGNKITFALAFDFTTGEEQTSTNGTIASFHIPASIGAKLYPYLNSPFENKLDTKVLNCWSSATAHVDGVEYAYKQTSQIIEINCEVYNLSPQTKYICRIEKTFLLSDNLAPQE